MGWVSLEFGKLRNLSLHRKLLTENICFSSEIIFGQLFWTFGDFFWSHCNPVASLYLKSSTLEFNRLLKLGTKINTFVRAESTNLYLMEQLSCTKS